MNTCIVLMIAFKLIHVVHSEDYHTVTENDIHAKPYTCTSIDERHILRKLQQDYTRWISAPFIVEVLDETHAKGDTTEVTSTDALYRIPVTDYTRFILPPESSEDASKTDPGERKYRRNWLSTDTTRRKKRERKISAETSRVARKRYKRTPQIDYWTFASPTHTEFIVKVPDDEYETYTPATSMRTPPMRATTILPVTRISEKIVLGGAIVTPMRTSTTSLGPIPPRDYTRFVPPTREESHTKDHIEPTPTIFIEALKPERTTEAIKNFSPIRHPLRDESPPAGPQFLPHSPLVAGPRQYAHLEPVAFTTITTNHKPITPPTPTAVGVLHESDVTLTEVSPELEELNKAFRRFELDELNEFPVTRTTTSLRTVPTREMSDRQIFQVFNDLVGEISKENAVNSIEITEPDLDAYKSGYIDEKKESDVTGDIEDAYSEISKNLDSVELLTKDLMNAIDQEYPGIFNDSETTYGEIDYPEKPVMRTFMSDNDTKSDFRRITIQEKPFIPLRNKPDTCSVLEMQPAVITRLPTLPEVNTRLKRWNEKYPIAKLFDITYGNLTFLENPIYAMVVDDPSRGQVVTAKKSVMVVGGIQGRDHYSVAASMYVLQQLIEKSETHAELLTKYRFLIIPVFNPDGFDYSMTFAHRRDWAKNLRQSWDACIDREACRQCMALGLSCSTNNCFGVNLDRNFEYQWLSRNELISEHPCGDLYPGLRQLSEPETIALTQYLAKLKQPLHAFITFKEGDVLGVLYPYSHTKRRRAHDYLFRQRADTAASAAASVDDRPYVAGQSSEYLQLYAGGIEDWVDAHLGVDFTFSIMLNRPQDAKRNNLKTEFVLYEAYAALDALLLSKVKAVSIAPVAKMSESGRKTLVRPSPPKVNKQHKQNFTYTLTLLPLILCIFEIIK